MLSQARWKWSVVGLAFLVPVLFASFTHHAWEDYFITLRASRHLVEGDGLVFNPGERVHTFTSPLGVLLPALCTLLAGAHHEERALWLFRLMNAGLLATAVGLTWRRAESLRLGPLGRVLLFGLLLADAKLTDFATNGMETAILVFFVLLLWTELEKPEGPRAGWIAAGVGGLMWTRPDAFVLGAALLLPHLIIRGEEPSRIRTHWPRLWRGVLVGGALYVPWFAWAWWYYGTPIPHTILAKSAFMPSVHLSSLLQAPWQTLLGQSLLIDLFLPANWSFGGWPDLLRFFSHALTGIAAFAWIAPGFSATARRASLGIFFGMFYVCSIILFPWYVPPWTVLGAIAVAFSLDHLYAAAAAAQQNWRTASLRTACVIIVLVQVLMLGGVAWQMRIEQRYVETGMRRQIGEWLHQNARPTDTVFLEPLGYIGYFSQLKTYDFPGLSSPEVVALIRSGRHRYADVIAHLNPTWLVLRNHEVARPEFRQNPVLDKYDLVKSWDAIPQLDAIRFLPGRSWIELEAQFLLFRRKPDAPP